MNDENFQRKLSPLLRSTVISQSEQVRQLIVETSGRKTDCLIQRIESDSGMIFRELKLLRALAIECPECVMAHLAEMECVVRIWSDVTAEAMLDIALPTIGASDVHSLGYDGHNRVVAVLDTGIDMHNDLSKPKNRLWAWNDLVNNLELPYDDNGHGTHVAGIVAGNGQESRGKYQGVAPRARLVGVKVLDEKGSGIISQVIAGIEWCIENRNVLGIDVMNLSLGAVAQESYRTDPLCRATTAAWDSGITVCTAAGNEGPRNRTISTPGINPRIITVGNFDDNETILRDDDRLNPSSGRGPTVDNLAKPDLYAPGTQIASLKNGGGYQTMSGTSMATPMVSGAVAVILQKWPDLTPDKIKKILTERAREINIGSFRSEVKLLDLQSVFNREGKLFGQRTEKEKMQKILFKAFARVAFEDDLSLKSEKDVLKSLVRNLIE